MSGFGAETAAGGGPSGGRPRLLAPEELGGVRTYDVVGHVKGFRDGKKFTYEGTLRLLLKALLLRGALGVRQALGKAEESSEGGVRVRGAS